MIFILRVFYKNLRCVSFLLKGDFSTKYLSCKCKNTVDQREELLENLLNEGSGTPE